MANPVISLRIDSDVLAALDAQAAADGQTRNQAIVLAIRKHIANAPTLDGSTRGAPTYHHVDQPTYDGISAGIPRSPAPTIHTATYERPKHDATCRCMLCKLGRQQIKDDASLL
jgi:hypothetical protein